MRELGNSVFSFSIGGLFRGYSSLEIHRDGDAYSYHHRKSLHANPEEHRGTLDKAQVDKLMAFLRDLGARDWFSSYHSPVLDGEQWQLFDGYRSYEGSNAYPKGFEKLLKYLADDFGCEEVRPQPGDTCDGPTESERLAMLAFYDLPSGEEARQRLENGESACDCREDWRQTVTEVERNFLRDIDAFVSANPEYRNYGAILARHGLELDIEQIVNQDMSKADAKLVVAFIIAIARFDRWCECDFFRRCVEDGTFARWTKRLRELL